jgi:cytochrome c
MKAMIISLALIATPAAADPGLLKKYNCTACHAPAAKLVGPAYAEVARKYAGQADAVARLSSKIKSGGSGVWGTIPMPPHPQVSDTDARAMAGYVLGIK